LFQKTGKKPIPTKKQPKAQKIFKKLSIKSDLKKDFFCLYTKKFFYQFKKNVFL
jgi:hypothetical protein